ncbi:MAG: hypothetical protein ACAH27_06000 [Xanthobacteraceae bacterium]
MAEIWLPGVGYTPHPDTWTFHPIGGEIVAPSAKGGTRKVIDMRGWGYLTGGGHGALGLDWETARAEQDNLAAFIIAACRKAAKGKSHA